MKSMLKWGLLAAVLTAFVGTAVPAQAMCGGSFTANPCTSVKLSCVGKKKACLLGCYKKATGGTPVSIDCLTKCRTKFDGGVDPTKGCFAKAEAKYGLGCATTGDTAALERKIDGFVQSAVGSLIGGFTLAGDPNKCLAAKINKLIGYNKCRLGLLIKAAKAGGSPDPIKVQKCIDKIDAAFAKLEIKYPGPAGAGQCFTYSDAATVRNGDNLFLDDVVAELVAGQDDMNTQRCTGDTSVKCTSAPGGVVGCGGPLGTCEFWFGSTLPLSAGGISTCVTNQWSGNLVGTANIESGASGGTANVIARVYNGLAITQPCPKCVGDTFPNDGTGVPCGTLGTCNGGLRNGLSCDINGISPNPDFGSTSLDCPPTPGGLISTLPVNLSNTNSGTVALTLSASSPNCNGAPGFKCACSSCSLDSLVPCSSDLDCSSHIPNAGLCTNAAGEPRQPNACIGGVCTDTAPVGDGEGECDLGPVDQNCALSTERGCTTATQATDCPAPGDYCVSRNRVCYPGSGTIGDKIEAQGKHDAPLNHWAHPTFASVFCVAPTASASVNIAAGLPGPGRLELDGDAVENGTSGSCPTQATFLPTSKGGVLDTGWTGIAHNANIVGQGKVTVTLSGCVPGIPGNCGTCNYTGPIANPNVAP